ncbi:MAG: helix-turn-helix transcriptional regulator [Ruminococcaceae bacterium]|nr:helix-turn-helix transcriptional regulator [Oscillospiraceae bacterium]
MKPRKQPYGDKNISGAIIERLRKEQGIKQLELISRVQLLGVDINPSSLSKLEGQQRIAADYELRAIAKVLNVSMDDLVPPIDPLAEE